MAASRSLLPIGAGFIAGYIIAQQAWTWNHLLRIKPSATLAAHAQEKENYAHMRGRRELEQRESEHYTVSHTIEDGIERISYYPKQRRFETPIWMQHGMWHGAWCWQPWQELLAEWGWESHASSLPGHAGSPERRPIKRCTLDYYLGYVKDEIERLPRRPVVFGHSMGGALMQWYFKYVGDDLPAAVLAAPWVAQDSILDGLGLFLKNDPLGVLSIITDWSATQLMRSPRSTAALLLGPDSAVSGAWLQARLGPESALVMMQHNRCTWQPAEQVRTPMLWLAGEKDGVITVNGARRSAAYYGADFWVVENAGHNLMMEQRQSETIRAIHEWLVQRGIC